MPRLPGPEKPRYFSVKAYLLDLAKDVATLVVDRAKRKRFREQLRIYNKMWTDWTTADEADRKGCWTPSMGKPKCPLNALSNYYNLRYDQQKEAKRLPGFYSLLAFIHDSQLPRLDKINNGIVSSEIIEKTLSAPRDMLEDRLIDGRTRGEDVREIYVIEEFFNCVKVDLKEHCEKGGDKLKTEESAKTEQGQQVKTLSDVELFEYLAKKFEKRARRVLEQNETWLSLDRSLKEYFDLAIQRLQLHGLTDNKAGLLQYQYKNLLHFARNIDVKSFRGWADPSIIASARKYATELAEKFKDLAQRAKEDLTAKKPAEGERKNSGALTDTVKLLGRVIDELEGWEKRYLPDNAQTGKIELVDIVCDEPLKKVIGWLEWRKHQPEVEKIKAECTKILRWFHTENGVLSKNLNDNPFVADQKRFSLKLTNTLQGILEHLRADSTPEKPAETGRRPAPVEEQPKAEEKNKGGVKKTLKVIGAIIGFLAALLTCIYLIWWLCTKFSA